MSLFVERTLDTEIGPVEIAITRADHISVQGVPVIRDTKFNCHLHFWKQADGTYAVREQDRPNMTRAWTNSDYSKPVPPTYFAKVLTAYTKSVNDFMATNSELAMQAESEDIEREIGRAEGKLQEANEVLKAAQAAVDALRAKRQNHQRTKRTISEAHPA